MLVHSCWCIIFVELIGFCLNSKGIQTLFENGFKSLEKNKKKKVKPSPSHSVWIWPEQAQILAFSFSLWPARLPLLFFLGRMATARTAAPARLLPSLSPADMLTPLLVSLTHWAHVQAFVFLAPWPNRTPSVQSVLPPLALACAPRLGRLKKRERPRPHALPNP